MSETEGRRSIRVTAYGDTPLNSIVIGRWQGLRLLVYSRGLTLIGSTWSSSAQCWPIDFIHHVMSYYNDNEVRFLNWTGANADIDRRAAGGQLATMIQNYLSNHPKNCTIRVVAHSHGGNASLVASAAAQIDLLVTLGTPILSGYGPGVNLRAWNNVYSTGDRVQTLPFGARRTHVSANNIRLTGFGHSDLHTVPAWDAAFPPQIAHP